MGHLSNASHPVNSTDPFGRDEEVAKIEIAVLSVTFAVAVIGNCSVLVAIHNTKKKTSRMHLFHQTPEPGRPSGRVFPSPSTAVLGNNLPFLRTGLSVQDREASAGDGHVRVHLHDGYDDSRSLYRHLPPSQDPPAVHPAVPHHDRRHMDQQFAPQHPQYFIFSLSEIQNGSEVTTAGVTSSSPGDPAPTSPGSQRGFSSSR